MKIFKDNVYGFIPIKHITALKIIDTYEFQRLRFIKQLGFTHFVFPGAQHTRFEHSIGTYHIINIFLDFLSEKYYIDKQLKELIAIAGLIHDIGHVSFSHMFDDCITPHLKDKSHHEVRTIRLFKKMNKKYDLYFSDKEIKLIENIILGKNDPKYPNFVFQIVANKKNELDLDKIDYLIRDAFYLGKPISFDYKYILAKADIIDDEICFNVKTSFSIFSLFNMRYELHKKFYNHEKVIVYQTMVKDAILSVKDKINFDKMFMSDEWLKLNDSLLHQLLEYPESRKIIQNVLSRKLYKLSEVKTNETITIKKRVGLTGGKKNPLVSINFFNKKEPNKIFNLDMKEISIFKMIHSYEIKEFYIIKK